MANGLAPNADGYRPQTAVVTRPLLGPEAPSAPENETDYWEWLGIPKPKDAEEGQDDQDDVGGPGWQRHPRCVYSRRRSARRTQML